MTSRLVATLLLISFQAFAQSGQPPALAKTSTAPSQGTSSSLEKLVKLPTKKSEGWSNSLDLSLGQPATTEAGTRYTLFENTLSYTFNKTHSVSLWLSGKQLWPDKRDSTETEEESEDGGNDSTKSFTFQDPYISWTRSDVISLDLNFGPPLSEEARLAGRQFAVSLEPSFRGSYDIFSFRIRSEWIYNRNRYKTIEDKGETNNEAYAVWSKASLTVKMTKKWSWFNRAWIYQSWDTESVQTDTYLAETGPTFSQNKNINWSLTYAVQDEVKSTKKFLHRDTGWVVLGLGLSI